MLSYEHALDKLLAAARPVEEVRSLPLTAALGRVLAAPQRSTVAVPPLDNSGMDGYAVRLADVPAAGTSLPVSQRIPAGTVGTTLRPGTAARIFTGAPVPAGADAVVMQELCEHGEGGVVVNHVPRPGENIRRAGEDIAAGAEILPAGIRLRPQDIALAASAGLPELPVFRRVRVGVFFTGDELVQPGEPLPVRAPPQRRAWEPLHPPGLPRLPGSDAQATGRRHQPVKPVGRMQIHVRLRPGESAMADSAALGLRLEWMFYAVEGWPAAQEGHMRVAFR